MARQKEKLIVIFFSTISTIQAEALGMRLPDMEGHKNKRKQAGDKTFRHMLEE